MLWYPMLWHDLCLNHSHFYDTIHFNFLHMNAKSVLSIFPYCLVIRCHALFLIRKPWSDRWLRYNLMCKLIYTKPPYSGKTRNWPTLSCVYFEDFTNWRDRVHIFDVFPSTKWINDYTFRAWMPQSTCVNYVIVNADYMTCINV